ncbi:MAG: DUF4388 domain-containing protein [Deltaproteobacteria bacterium]|nr:DUF4388 domain-containing protein [Deltaproteobacteria bacterium]
MTDRRFIDVLPDGTIQASGSAEMTLLASRCGRYWLHESHPELVLLTFAGLERTASTVPVERAILLADISGFNPIDLFGMIAQSRLSLRIIAVRQGVERVLLFRDGDIAMIASNESHDRIGDFLVRMGLVDRERLEAVLAAANPGRRRAGQLLVESGLITSHDLWRAIQKQLTELFCDVATWSSGHLVGYRLPEGFAFPPMPPLGTQGLLLEAVRRFDEISLIRHRIPDSGVVLQATGKQAGENDEERAFLDSVQQPASIAELQHKLHRPEFDLLRLAYSLLQSGAVQQVTASACPQRPQGSRVGDVLQVFDMAFNEIHDEVRKAGVAAQFVAAINAFLGDPKSAYTTLFRGVELEIGAPISEEILLRNLTELTTGDPVQTLSDALNELLFFALFQCGELLETSVDVDLARRVRLIYSTLTEG